MPHLLTTFLTASDGAVAGASLGVLAALTYIKYLTSRDTLDRVHNAPTVRVSDLRRFVKDHDEGMLIVVRGQIQMKPSSLLGLKNPGPLLAECGGTPSVVIHRTTCSGSWQQLQDCVKSKKLIPFVLVDSGMKSPVLHVMLKRSQQNLPLQECESLHLTTCTIKESILPVGKEICVIGNCRYQKGDLHIESNKEIPFYLTNMDKDEIEAEISSDSNALLWSTVVLAMLSAGFLVFTIIRKYQRRRMKRETIRRVIPPNPRDIGLHLIIEDQVRDPANLAPGA